MGGFGEDAKMFFRESGIGCGKKLSLDCGFGGVVSKPEDRRIRRSIVFGFGGWARKQDCGT
jgi:hypothetical protein